jgi:hypothetical protein
MLSTVPVPPPAADDEADGEPVRKSAVQPAGDGEKVAAKPGS